MFDRYILVEDTLRNVTGDGLVSGYQLGARLPYYRGLGLSMVEGIALTVDGARVPDARIALTVHGHRYRLEELPGVFDDRWEMGEVATLSIDGPGGLAAGEHDVVLDLRLRISYMPVPGGGADHKVLTLR